MIKGILSLTAALSLAPALNPIAAATADDRAEMLNRIIDNLRSLTDYSAQTQFTVTMPQLADDVNYRIGLACSPGVAEDTIESVNYMMEWELVRPDNPVKGFTAYISPGHFYRYDGHRLREYHADGNSSPFAPDGDRSRGVQRTAQFAGLLPGYLADEITAPARKGDLKLWVSPDTLVRGEHRAVIHRTVYMEDGEISSEATYIFSLPSLLPAEVVYENNPGAISEQTIIVRYMDADDSTPATVAEEQELIDRFPEVFSHDRDDSFRLLSLPGNPLPAFSAPTTGGERLTRRRGEGGGQPAVLVLLQAGGEFTAATVSAVRQALAQLPFGAETIFGFTDTNPDDITSVTGPAQPGETILVNSGKLARDCGATLFPVVILLRGDGIVADVIPAYNNNLSSDVIRKMTPLAP